MPAVATKYHLPYIWSYADILQSFRSWSPKEYTILNYFATSNIPQNIISIYHLNICLHLNNEAHFETYVILDIFVQYHHLTTFPLCSFHRKCQYCAKRLRNGNYSYELFLVSPVYHLNICAPFSHVVTFKADHNTVMATKYHLPTIWPCADILKFFCRWRPNGYTMLNYFATTNIPHIVIPIYHLNICLHLNYVAHFKPNVILHISVQYNLHTIFPLRRKSQYSAKGLRNGNYSY